MPRSTEDAVPLFARQVDIRSVRHFHDALGIGSAGYHLYIGWMPDDPRCRDAGRCRPVGFRQIIENIIQFSIVLAVTNEDAFEKAFLEGLRGLQHHALEARIIEEPDITINGLIEASHIDRNALSDQIGMGDGELYLVEE